MDEFNLSAFSSIEYCVKCDDAQPLGKLSQHDLDLIMLNFIRRRSGDIYSQNHLHDTRIGFFLQSFRQFT